MKRFYVFVKGKEGSGWKTDSFDTPEEANHFAGLWKEEDKSA